MLDYIKELNEKGIAVERNGDKLKVHLLKDDVDERLFEDIRLKKNDLLTFLSGNITRFETIPSAPVMPDYPVSAMQHKIWIHSQYPEASVTYNMPFQITIDQVEDISGVLFAIHALIDRHETLRTLFRINSEGEVRQFILSLEEINFTVNQEDFQGRSKEEINQFIQEESLRSFDLDKGPLIHTFLIKIDNNAYILFFNIHHIVFDGTSVDILQNDFKTYYKAYLNGETPELNKLRIQYKDFSVWYNEALEKEFSKSKIYWQEELKEAVSPIDLPFSKKRPKFKTYRGKQMITGLDRELVKNIKNFSVKNHISVFSTLISIWKTLVFKYTSQRTLVAGVPVSGREHSDLNNQIGFYVNTVIVKNTIDPVQSFASFASEVNRKLILAVDHQQYPIDLIINDLKLDWDPSRNPLFDIMLKYQNLQDVTRLSDSKDLRIKDLGFVPARFDINLEFIEEKEDVFLNLVFNSAIFDKKDIRRIIKHFKELAFRILKNPEEALQNLEYLSSEEKNVLLNGFNNTEKEYSDCINLIDLLNNAVQCLPDQTAFVDDTDHMTYSELDQTSNKIANFLIKNGTSKGEYIALYMGRKVAFVSALYGVLKTGATYVPIDSGIPKERLKFIIRDLGITKIFTDNEHMARVEGIYVEEGISSHIIINVATITGKFLSVGNIKTFAEIEKEDGWFENPISIAPDDEAYIIYTSGSTGEPKGVVIQHFPIINVVEWVNKTFSVSSQDKLLMVSSVSFDLSVYDIFGGIAAGATVRIATHSELKLLNKLNEIIVKESITTWNSAPAFMNVVSEAYTGKADTSLRLTLLSGDWIPLTLPGALKKYNKKNTVISLGGATEATIWSNFFVVNKQKKEWSSIPYGKPIQNAHYYIFNEELQLCPIGMEGDLYIGGKVLAKEYKNNKGLTEERFIYNPFSPNERIYKTGDRAKYFKDGNIEFLGRNDDQLKIRGYRVELGEIRKTILLFTGITNCLLLVVGEKTDKRIIAFYISGQELNVSDLRSFLSERIPEYMIPEAFLSLDEIPLTSNGKVNNTKLKDLYQKESASFKESIEIIKPDNSTEEEMLNIWLKILNIEEGQISVIANFFEIGGNSIHLIKLLSQINVKYNFEVKIQDFITDPTIRSVSKLIMNSRKNRLKI